MKYVFKDLSNIKNKIKKSGFALLLDFDLTLSPLAKNPNHAFLPETTKDYLKKIATRAPVAIITGRELSDIKKKVNIKEILYVGNHGLEHDLDKKHKIALDFPFQTALLKAKKELKEKCKAYSGIIFEDKKYVFALGYRLVKKNDVHSLLSILKKFQKDIKQDNLLEARLEKKTFELRPKTGINKGTACRLVLRVMRNKSHKKIMPVYLGDGKTDEDAFLALRGKGITIRVGKNKNSVAGWYVRNQKEVNLFLKWLCNNKPNKTI